MPDILDEDALLIAFCDQLIEDRRTDGLEDIEGEPTEDAREMVYSVIASIEVIDPGDGGAIVAVPFGSDYWLAIYIGVDGEVFNVALSPKAAHDFAPDRDDETVARPTLN